MTSAASNWYFQAYRLWIRTQPGGEINQWRPRRFVCAGHPSPALEGEGVSQSLKQDYYCSQRTVGSSCWNECFGWRTARETRSESLRRLSANPNGTLARFGLKVRWQVKHDPSRGQEVEALRAVIFNISTRNYFHPREKRLNNDVSANKMFVRATVWCKRNSNFSFCQWLASFGFAAFSLFIRSGVFFCFVFWCEMKTLSG